MNKDEILQRIKQYKEILSTYKELIISEHARSISTINQMTMCALQEISSYKEICQNLEEDVSSNSRDLFPSFSGIAQNFSLSDWKVPRLVINQRLFIEKLYSFEDVSAPFTWESDFLRLFCEHENPELFAPRCKKRHCKECLKKNLDSNQRVCPCGSFLSIKDVHMIQGIPLSLRISS